MQCGSHATDDHEVSAGVMKAAEELKEAAIHPGIGRRRHGAGR